MSSYTIKDLEYLTGIKAHTLRIWEQRYKIIVPKRSEKNIRYYDDRDLKLMLNVSLLNTHGLKISKIAKLNEEEIRQEVLKHLEDSNSYEDQISQLTESMLNYNEAKFEKVVSSCILKYGFEDCMVNIIFPFLTKIGVLWQIGAISPAQEHFISNLIRQKIIVALDALMLEDDAHQSKIILFLPEGELHEITLLFASYILKARGFKVIYLGQSLPINELKEVYEFSPAEYMLSISTSLFKSGDLQSYITELGEAFPKVEILLTGRQVIGMDYKLTDNLTVLASIPQFIEFAERVTKQVTV